MRFYKSISVLLHPIVLPTLGILVYFLLVPSRLVKEQRLAILGLIFIATYIIPLLILFLLKIFGQIQSYQLISIKERKFPLTFMIVLYYLLGKTLFNSTQIRDLGILFYAISFGLIVVYTLFLFKLKTSLHVLSMGIVLGFFLLMSTLYTLPLLPILFITILLTGLVASARLHLKAHTPKEVYLGFFIGLLAPFLVSYFL